MSLCELFIGLGFLTFYPYLIIGLIVGIIIGYLIKQIKKQRSDTN